MAQHHPPLICVECGSRKARKTIYYGLPHKHCPTCTLLWGWPMILTGLLPFNGKLFYYSGSYWKALWHWLAGTYEDG